MTSTPLRTFRVELPYRGATDANSSKTFRLLPRGNSRYPTVTITLPMRADAKDKKTSPGNSQKAPYLKLAGKKNIYICSGEPRALRRTPRIAGRHPRAVKHTKRMEKCSVITLTDFKPEELEEMLQMAAAFEAAPNRRLLEGRVVATLFFEPSTRTRLSFETAAWRMGARVIGFSDPNVTSSTKGETLHDTIKMVSGYADVIIMRHYLEGAARYASEIADVPIINAGDGSNQHPSQTLLDLYAIKKTQGTLSDLHLCLVGDLKYGRTVHSLLPAMRHWNPSFTFVAPDELRMPAEWIEYCDEHSIAYKETSEFTPQTLRDVDVLYMTRVQRERFSDLMEYERVKDRYVLEPSLLNEVKPTMKVLHPLPRLNEISPLCDADPHAFYFQQARGGLYARQALISWVLGLRLNDILRDKSIIR